MMNSVARFRLWKAGVEYGAALVFCRHKITSHKDKEDEDRKNQ